MAIPKRERQIKVNVPQTTDALDNDGTHQRDKDDYGRNGEPGYTGKKSSGSSDGDGGTGGGHQPRMPHRNGSDADETEKQREEIDCGEEDAEKKKELEKMLDELALLVMMQDKEELYRLHDALVGNPYAFTDRDIEKLVAAGITTPAEAQAIFHSRSTAPLADVLSRLRQLEAGKPTQPGRDSDEAKKKESADVTKRARKAAGATEKGGEKETEGGEDEDGIDLTDDKPKTGSDFEPEL